MYQTNKLTETEKAILVGVILPRHSRWEVEENLAELKLLAATAGVDVVGELMQDRERIHPGTFVGSGKVEELARMVQALKASTVIFDEDLTPAQVRNLERSTGSKIIDRSTLILDIFARHARSREAKTQVELAQLQHLLPRLTRQWSHLSRQVGGIGTKGPGETQLETDRRLIRQRIATLRKSLEKIEQQRGIRRRRREGIFKVSLIGYTNVGKSTIMNLFSQADVTVEDQLFATLDSTIRKVWLDKNHQILLSDTVGFIRKLPHQLIASFKSTLDEVRDSDLLLHIIDVSHPAYQEQMDTVNEVLREIGVGEKPVLLVFNKIDLLENKNILSALKSQYPGGVFISARRHIRINHLRNAIVQLIEQHYVSGEVLIPHSSPSLIKLVHDLALVVDQQFTETGVRIRFHSTVDNKTRLIHLIQENVKQIKKGAFK